MHEEKSFTFFLPLIAKKFPSKIIILSRHEGNDELNFPDKKDKVWKSWPVERMQAPGEGVVLMAEAMRVWTVRCRRQQAHSPLGSRPGSLWAAQLPAPTPR